MEELIEYKAVLVWGKLIKLSPEVMKTIIDDINSFQPTIHIGSIPTIVKFTVANKKGCHQIIVHFSISRSSVSDVEEVNEGMLAFIDNILVDRIKDLLFAINLAYPGHLHIYSSFLYRDGSPVEEFSFSTDISGWAYEECQWIPYEKLTIQQCWDWLCSKTNFLSGVSKTSIDRALHTLSYESVANEDMYIFYIMLGLEAIYNNGSNNEESISAQMKRKVQAILGAFPPKGINDIKTMYRQRSYLVHGNANIFKCWGSDNCTESEATKMGMERNYIVSATGILIATIQHFIKANANVLKETVTVTLGAE